VVGLLFLNLLGLWAFSDVPNRYADRFGAVSPRLRYQSRIAEVGRFLRTHMTPNDAVVIDDYNVESNLIADAAGLPMLSVERVYLASAEQTTNVREYIRHAHPRFLVYSDQGKLRDEIVLPHGCDQSATVEGAELRCRMANKIYRVYELQYGLSQSPTISTSHGSSDVNE
jgi:hypothetical protein